MTIKNFFEMSLEDQMLCYIASDGSIDETTVHFSETDSELIYYKFKTEVCKSIRGLYPKKSFSFNIHFDKKLKKFISFNCKKGFPLIALYQRFPKDSFIWNIIGDFPRLNSKSFIKHLILNKIKNIWDVIDHQLRIGYRCKIPKKYVIDYLSTDYGKFSIFEGLRHLAIIYDKILVKEDLSEIKKIFLSTANKNIFISCPKNYLTKENIKSYIYEFEEKLKNFHPKIT